jgi:hypothetical protein
MESAPLKSWEDRPRLLAPLSVVWVIVVVAVEEEIVLVEGSEIESPLKHDIIIIAKVNSLRPISIPLPSSLSGGG